MVLPPTAGSQKARVLATLSRLEAGGSTAGAEGIRLAYQLAREGFLKDGNNRVVLATDGDFNIGVTSEGELVRLIEKEREGGVYLTVLGFGTGNLQDAKMEQLADHGNGHYAYIDTLLEARRVLVEQMGATLLTVAKDVKLQVEFNPAQVKAYRLLGYENRRLRDEEFNDDRRDAGDMGAGHSVTALYEVIPVGSDEAVPGVDPLKYQRTAVRESAAESDEVLTVKLRYKRPEESESHLLVQVIRQPDSDGALPSDAFLFSSAVAEFGLLLRDSPYKGEAQYVHAYDRAVEALGRDEGGRRSELLSLIQTARSLAVEPKTMRESPDGDG
jgi:Ca-activated chloride channel family protein